MKVGAVRTLCVLAVWIGLMPTHTFSSDINSGPVPKSAGTWSVSAALMNQGRSGYTMTMLDSGNILVVGGISNGVQLSTAEVYNPTNQTWSTTGSLNKLRWGHTATKLANGKVLVTGGQNNDNNGTTLKECELYDPATGTWSFVASMAAARTSHTATLLNSGKVLVAGGTSSLSGGSLSSTEIYTVGTTSAPLGTWAAGGSLSTARYNHTATLLPGGTSTISKVLIVGGQSGGTANDGSLASAEISDNTTATWSATGAMNVARGTPTTAVLLSNGKILVAGGYNKTLSYLKSVDLYDPVTGVWTALAPLGVARDDQIAVLLANNNVLIAGGINDSGPLSSASLYNPVADSWTDVPAMSQARDGHAAVLLNGDAPSPDTNKILVAGGYNSNNTLSTVELYNPGVAQPTATTSAPDNIASGSMNFKGIVNEHELSTVVTFDSALAGVNYNVSTTATPSPVLPGSGDTTVSANKLGLTCNTSYHYRVKAVNSLVSAGSAVYGADMPVTTGPCIKPTVTANAAANVTKISATLNGVVDDNGSITNAVHFELGTSTSYGTSIAANLPIVGPGTAGKAVSANVSLLACNTLYHYRLVATNTSGTSPSNDQTFTTLACVAPTVTAVAPVVSPIDVTFKGTVNGNGANTNVIFEYGPTTSYGSTIAATPSVVNFNTVVVAVSAVLSVGPATPAAALLCNATYHYRVKADNSVVIGTVITSGGISTSADTTVITAPCIPPTATTGNPSNITTVSATLNGVVNGNGAMAATSVTFELGTDTSYSLKAPAATPSTVAAGSSTDISITGGATGLTCSTVYHYRINAKSAAGGNTVNGLDNTFTTASCIPPTVTTSAATKITNNSATLNGSVNDNGANTSIFFEYGINNVLSNNMPATPPTVLAGTGLKTVTANVTNLVCGTDYKFHIGATANNATVFGGDLAFTTSACPGVPIVTTKIATGITATSAILAATVDDHGADTTVTFNYGIDTSYGTPIVLSTVQKAGTGSTNLTTTITTGTLFCGTTYHYQVAATNSYGTASGNDQSFTTSACIPADLSVTVDDGRSSVSSMGDNLVYKIVISNAGPSVSNGALLQAPAISSLTIRGITCENAIGGAVCPTSLDPATLQTSGLVIPTFPLLGSLTFKVDTWSTVPNGVINYTATIVAPHTVGDTDSTNNTAIDRDRVVSNMPNLRIGGVEITPPAPTAGGSITAVVTVQNTGTVAASGAILGLWLDQSSVQVCGIAADRQSSIGTLAPGATTTLTFTNLPVGSSGVKSLRTFADTNCTVAEYDETDNQSVNTYLVNGAPDLQVTGITLNPASPTTSSTFSATITVTNVGNEASNWVFLDVWKNQPATQGCGGSSSDAWVEVDTLAPGDSINITVTGLTTPSVGGNMTLRAFVDSLCEIDEPNESNNQLTKSYTVQSTSAYNVSPSVEIGGNVSPNVVQSVNAGATQSFTVTPNIGYIRDPRGVSGTCPQGSWNGTTWTTGPISASCTVDFSFFCQECMPGSWGWRLMLYP